MDPNSRKYFKMAMGGIFALGLVIVMTNIIYGVHNLETIVSEKKDILKFIRDADQELRALKGRNRPPTPSNKNDSPLDWNSFFENTAATAGIDPKSLTIPPSKKIRNRKKSKKKASKNKKSKKSAKETLFEIQVSQVNIRQLVRYAFYLENGIRPIKLKHLKISRKDSNGNLAATLYISAFTFKK